MHLWWDHDEAFVDGVFGKNGDTSSSNNEIQGNDILSCETALLFAKDTDTKVRWNVLHAREIVFDLGPETRPGSVEHNLWSGSRSRSQARR